MIYLDNNATTKVDEKVLEAMLPFFKEEYSNPSSMYDFSRKSALAVKESRGKIKDFVNASNEREIIFTSCGSESANLAIRGALDYNRAKRHIITTQVEHPCVMNTYKAFENLGYEVDYIGVNSYGELDLEELKTKIRKDFKKLEGNIYTFKKGHLKSMLNRYKNKMVKIATKYADGNAIKKLEEAYV